MVDILHNISAMLITCRRQVSRVAQCLKNKVLCLSNSKKRRRTLSIKKGSTEEDQEGVVWRNTILMGEKCRPLNFSGAIHYDSDGNPTPVPRSPMRSPLPYFIYSEKVEAN
ncbi:hypothetical protein LUZ61_014428 [Rhynchospora tenuis]|uniref:Uncharacterized protein n=1 Tax=Rhynchospora tenuis TaxID=198213 RepID=A0AAD5WBB0_9POAL|nr:hypothetical protein LUZ61_014428 [Rhynchospora tenuis]